MSRRYQTAHTALRARLELRAGLVAARRYRLEELQESEWHPEFEQLMRARLVMGAFRYGSLAENRGKGSLKDNVGSAIQRLQRYLQDGNLEHLVDAANLCLVEFSSPMCHPRPVWAPQDDGEHAKEK